MYYVYVLRSLKNGKRYTGYSSKRPIERMQEHNLKSNVWTRHNGPFKLIYEEVFPDKSSALRRERFFKTGNGRKVLDRFIL